MRKNDEELLSLSFWVYDAPWFYYISQDGYSYSVPFDIIYNRDFTDFRKLFENEKYKESRLIIKSPARIKEWTLFWHYFVKDARTLYIQTFKKDFEYFLKSYKIWFLVDKDQNDSA